MRQISALKEIARKKNDAYKKDAGRARVVDVKSAK
jgi:hypothetical protein